MTAAPHPADSAPRKALRAPESAETPRAGVSRRSDPLSGPQTGAEGFGVEWQNFNDPDAPECDPSWTDCEPADRTPTPFDLRNHEMWDLRGQGPEPVALWTAHNVPTGSYL